MRASRRSDEVRAVQRESMLVAAELRKALSCRRPLEPTSPEQGGFRKPPFFSGGRAPRATWDICLCTDSVTDRPDLTLWHYFLHCG